jgi:hypothetical protein
VYGTLVLMHEKIIIWFLVISLLVLDGFLFLVAKNAENAEAFAIMQMSWGLSVVWVFLGGSILYRYRNRIRTFVQKIPLDWRIVFVVFATLLALLEEAVTVSLTNLAPVFGVPWGEVGITASTNYFDVVLFHSVIVFIPLFIAWAIVLSRYNFKPFSVFILFGIMGIFAEATLVGPVVALIGFSQWIFVYGLMVYLPAYCIPQNRNARPVGVIHHILAIPAVFLLALPLLVPIVYVISSVLGHPSLHL